MGQQQLLLIVLGVIIVGISVVVGINIFNSNAISANRNAVITDLNNLGTTAMQYYKTPKAMAGGGNKFTGWKIPASLKATANGTYTATVSAQSIKIVGVGTEKGDDGRKKVKATATVTPTKITSKKNN